MRAYERRPSPRRLRQASLLVIGLSGASTGLLGGIGWRLFDEGLRELGVQVWLVAGALVVVYLLVARLARVIALLVEADPRTGFAEAWCRLRDRVDELERNLDPVREAGVATATASTVSAFEPPVGSSAL